MGRELGRKYIHSYRGQERNDNSKLMSLMTAHSPRFGCLSRVEVSLYQNCLKQAEVGLSTIRLSTVGWSNKVICLRLLRHGFMAIMYSEGKQRRQVFVAFPKQ